MRTARKQDLPDDAVELHSPPYPVAGARNAARDMIDEEIRIRDRHQFEIKLHYPLRQDKPVTVHELECYVFIPQSLGIHRGNYSKTSFYNDLQTHIRFKTPAVTLTAIAGPDDSPLSTLETSVRQMTRDAGPAAVAAFEYRIKLFCCILKSALRDFVDFVSDTVDPEDRGNLVAEYLGSVEKIIAGFRALRSEIMLPTVPQGVRSVYAFADEYISLLVERHSYELLEILRGTSGAGLRKKCGDAKAVIADEVRYREARGYPSVPDPEDDNEELIFRRNVLKKYMENVLFLDTRTHLEGKVLEHGLFGIAAGVSMLFATAVLFVSQSLYGTLTMPVFLALVIGYMFKDRIKELLRVYFSRAAAGALFDHKTKIFSDPKTVIGMCRESFDFVDEKKVPAGIMKIRDRDHITEIESDWLCEDVMRYRKRVKLRSEAVSAAYQEFETDGVNDIIRFNIAAFTQHMGNPHKELYVLDKDDYRRIKGERVYHMNLVLRYGGKDALRYKRFRIVLNRRKIKRIEIVSDEAG